MLTDRELAQMRAVQFEAMPDRVEVQRRTNVDDGFGGQKDDVWVPIASDLPARVTQAQTLDMGGQGARMIEIEKWVFRLPFGTDCKEFDRIVWEGLVILVDEVKSGSWRTVLTAAGERVK